MAAQARGLRTSQIRRFPPPRSVEETEACFIVRDSNGQALALRLLRAGLLVFCGAHSLSSSVPFAHVRTIFSVSVIVITGEMVDF